MSKKKTEAHQKSLQEMMTNPIMHPKNYYGFDHAKVNEHFGGDLTFKNSFTIEDKNTVVAVYHAANPDREKGHKDYMLLFKNNDKLFVAGRTAEEMEKERYHNNAMQCLECAEIIYSTYQHDFCSCSCGSCSVDGGKSYGRVLAKDFSKTRSVKVDLLECKVVE